MLSNYRFSRRIMDYRSTFAVRYVRGTIKAINNLEGNNDLLTGASKKWAIEAVQGHHDEDEVWISLDIRSCQPYTVSTFCNLFSINMRTFRGWMRKRVNHDFTGKPRMIDDATMDEVYSDMMSTDGGKQSKKKNHLT